jgi:hypothetical protein
MIKRSSFLLLTGGIHANSSSYFLQCTDVNLYFLKYLKIAWYYDTVCH